MTTDTRDATAADGWDLDVGTAGIALACITALALVLRLIGIGSDLWLDEVAPVNQYRLLSALDVLTTYTSANNHVLNTLLVKFSTWLAGESEWVIRTPAVLFGVATVPLTYWVTRVAATRVESLCVALLMAVSYHHVFFSQNARGYSSYLFFSLLGTGLLLRGLDAGRPGRWGAYVACMVLDFAALLHAFFVFAGHILVTGVWLRVRATRGRPADPSTIRLLVVFAVCGLLGVALYTPMAMQALATLRTTYSSPASGMPVTSTAFRADFVRGLVEGFGPGLLIAAPFVIAIVAYGFVILVRRNWALAMALVSPLMVLVALIVVKNLTASPRFFLLGIPTAFISLVFGIFAIARRLVPSARAASRSMRAVSVATAVVSLGALASLATLRAYYATPKQSYRAAVAYLQQVRRPGELIILIQNAEEGFRFYASRAGLVEGTDYVALRSVDSLAVVRRLPRQLILVSTLERSLIEAPGLQRSMEAGWSPTMTFPATIHDGEIRIWQQRPSSSTSP